MITKGIRRYVALIQEALGYKDKGTDRYKDFIDGGADTGLDRIGVLAIGVEGIGFDISNLGTVNDVGEFTYIINNNSLESINISQVVISAESNVVVTIISQPVSVLSPGLSTSFTISVEPIDNGSISFNISLTIGIKEISFAVSGTGVVPHPATGTGGTWFDVESTLIWDDEAATDPSELTEAEAVVRVDTNEKSGNSNYLYSAANMRYSPVTHATPNGKPSIYCITDTFTPLAYYYSTTATPVACNSEVTGRQFGRVIVAKRISSTDNVVICQFGSNRPMNSRTRATGITAYGFVSGFTQALASSWGSGDWAVLAYRWNETTTELEVSINGGTWQATTGGDSRWVPDAGSITLMGGNIAVAFDWYFDGDSDTLTGYADLDEFITELKDWYGIT